MNSRGQLGRGYTSDEMKFLKPEIIKFPQQFRIKQICCGLYHTIVLTARGYLYSWGDNSHGQIGVNNNNNKDSIVSIPTKIIQFIEPKIKFNYIFCSDYSSFAITSDGIVYYWGLFNEQIENNMNEMFVPKILKTEMNIKNIISMKVKDIENDVLVVLTNDGILYFFDQNIFICIDTEVKFKSIHYKPNEFGKILSYITIAVSNDDTIYILYGKSLIKTNYKNLIYFYLNEFSITSDALDYKEYKSNIYRTLKPMESKFKISFSKLKDKKKILGEGGYGKVYKVVDNFDENSVYAVKKIKCKGINELLFEIN